MRRRHFCFIAAAVLFFVFIIDILVAKVQVLMGESIPIHLGDTLQFLVLLFAVTFFVIGTLGQEKARNGSDKKSDDDK